MNKCNVFLTAIIAILVPCIFKKDAIEHNVQKFIFKNPPGRHIMSFLKAIEKENDPLRLSPHADFNSEGDIEVIGLQNQSAVVHHFTTTMFPGQHKWHYVTTEACKNSNKPPMVFLHGHVQSWWMWSNVIADFGELGECIYAFDLLGYGQSEKPDFEGANPPPKKDFNKENPWSWKVQAYELARVLRSMNLNKIVLITHDRGSTLGDYIIDTTDQDFQVLRYVRCQQQFIVPHALPRPPQPLFRDVDFSETFLGSPKFQGFVFQGPLGPLWGRDPSTIPWVNMDRLKHEFAFEGAWQGCAMAFHGASFAKEWKEMCNSDLKLSPKTLLSEDFAEFEIYDKYQGKDYNIFSDQSVTLDPILNCSWQNGGIISKMTMPTLILQGGLDHGMPPWTYFHVPQALPDATVEILNSGWYIHQEVPEDVTNAIQRFLKKNPLV